MTGRDRLTGGDLAAGAVAHESDILRVDDLHVEFPVRRGLLRPPLALRAVSGLSFGIRRGETLGLVGESGCGKSTLVRTILGIHRPTRGAVSYRGMDLSQMSDRRRRAYRWAVQAVFQDPQSSLDPRMTVHDIVAEPLRVSGRYTAARVATVLDQVGLSAAMAGRRPREFSGGQRQRIGIARALALEPEVLVLDEPVSALDVSVQAQVINLLDELQRELGLAYLFIAHDLSVVRHVSDHIAVMYLGKIVETGTRAEVFDTPAHPYTRALLDAIPLADPARRGRPRVRLEGEMPDPADPPTGCAFRTRCPVARPACAELDVRLAPVPAVPAARPAPTVPGAAAGAHLAACPF